MRERILLSYTANPLTTAAYLEKALRAEHDVVTYGPCIQDEILRAWNLEGIRDRVRGHDIPFVSPDLGPVLERLPKGWRPDLFLWVESGIRYPLEGLDSLGCPTACYLVDTHLNLETHLEIARRFDHVFIAQKAYLPRFREAGCRSVCWLPLGCDPEVHGKQDVEKRYDLAFVGSVTASNPERNRILLRLAERFPLHVERCFLEDMTRVFSASRIVFNRSVRDDLNMRVFEALASGSLLVTDEAPGSGLTEVFQDGRHVAVYRSDSELFEKVAYYLRHDEERERIAEAGRRQACAEHTYACRVRRMLSEIGLAGRADSARPTPVRQPVPGEGEGCEAPPPGSPRSEPHDVAGWVGEAAGRVLDVGCGVGGWGRTLKAARPACRVWGVERDPAAAGEAARWLDHVAVADAARWEPPVPEGAFEAILFADVLEHFQEPAEVLRHYLRWLAPAGRVVLSLPNVKYWGRVRHLLEGNWTYRDGGILDRGHLRFFTRKEILRLLEACGLEAWRISSSLDPRCPQIPDGRRVDLDLGRFAVRDLSPEEAREFFHVQYVVVAVRKREWAEVRAGRLAAGENRSEAFCLYAHLHERYPQEAGFLARMIELAGSEETRRRTLEPLQAYLDTHPAHVDFQLAAAGLLAGERRYDEARARLERILLFVPDHAEAQAGLAFLAASCEAAPGGAGAQAAQAS